VFIEAEAGGVPGLWGGGNRGGNSGGKGGKIGFVGGGGGGDGVKPGITNGGKGGNKEGGGLGGGWNGLGMSGGGLGGWNGFGMSGGLGGWNGLGIRGGGWKGFGMRGGGWNGLGTNGGGKNGFGGKKKSSAKNLLSDWDLSEILVVGLVLNTLVFSGVGFDGYVFGKNSSCFLLQKLGFSIGLNEKNPAENMSSPCFLVLRLTVEKVEIEATEQWGSVLLNNLKVHPLILLTCFLTLNGSCSLNSPYSSVFTSFLNLGIEFPSLHSTATEAPAQDRTKSQSSNNTWMDMIWCDLKLNYVINKGSKMDLKWNGFQWWIPVENMYHKKQCQPQQQKEVSCHG